MPDINSLKIGAVGWIEVENSPKRKIWEVSESETIVLDFIIPTDFKKDLLDPEIQKEFEGFATKGKGVLIDFEVTKIKGLEVAKQIYKFRYPDSLALIYIGTLAFPLADFCYILKCQCIETGTTGMREAAVEIILSKDKPREKSKKDPIFINSMEEYFELIKQTPLTKLPADDEKYDEGFPEHPLSKTRYYLKYFADNLIVDLNLQNAKPYRVSSIKSSGFLDKIRGFFNND